MRILVLNYEFPPVGGGGGRASAELVHALSARGHDLQVFTSQVKGLPRSELWNGVRVTRVATGRRDLYRASFSSMARYALGGFRPGLQLVRGWEPDVIHAHFAVPTGALAYAIHRVTGAPYVLTTHLGDVPGGVPEKTEGWFRFVDPLTPVIWNSASSVVAVSEFTRKLAALRYHVAIKVIPNGISLPVESALDFDPGQPPRLIFAGRFQPQKNLPSLVDALAKISDLAWNCEMVGDGPEMAAVKHRVRVHGLEARITLPGWVGEDQVLSRLKGSDVLVMPSLSEGLPVIGIQALAHGLAIVASRAGGLADLVEDEVNGRLTPIGDMEGFADALRWTLENGSKLRQMKKASRARAAAYDIGGVAGKYEALFETVRSVAAAKRED